MNRKIINDDTMHGLDLKSFNEGRNPYPEGDSSLANAFVRGVDFYRSYIEDRAKFTGGERVLDLLCGFGRWAPFLAESNQFVVGIDRLEDCTRLATNLCRHLGFENTEFLTGEAELTHQFSDNYFDFVWMWSALQYVHRGKVLKEVYRILKPGGRLYVGNYNGPGLMVTHFLNGVKQNKINEGASQWALNALVNSEKGNGNPNYLTPEAADGVLGDFGFRVVAACDEGRLDLSVPNGVKGDKPRRVDEFGLAITMEFIAEK